MRTRGGLLAAVLAVIVMACGGSAVATGGAGSPTAMTPSSPPAATPMATASAAPSEAASPTPLAGFEGWKSINPWAVETTLDPDGALRMKLLTRVLWFNDERGSLLFDEVTGDFTITATVRTASASDPDAPLAQNGVTQFAGVMARAHGASENYVFIVVGNSVNGPAVETKTTVNSRSTWDGPAWPSPDAELRLCRAGSTFTLLKRAADSDDPWTVAGEFDRPDLPDELQVGPNIYSDQEPDMTARWEDLEIREGDPGDCAGS